MRSSRYGRAPTLFPLFGNASAGLSTHSVSRRQMSAWAVMLALSTTLISPALATTLENAASQWISPHYRTHPLVGTIWTAEFDRTTRAEFDSALTDATHILLGEIHPNVDHHLLQAGIIDGLVKAGRRPAVVFEMVPREFQLTLDAFSRDKSRDPAQLGAALQWQQRGWPDWGNYRPIADVALSSELLMVAGDMATSLRKSVSRSGLSALDTKLKTALGLDQALDPAAAQALEQEIIVSHCNLLPQDAVERIVDVQRVRDASLAAAMLQGRTQDGAVLIAGSGHIRRDWAVPHYIRKERPEASTISVAFVEVDAGLRSSEDYAQSVSGLPKPFDFIYFTPRSEVKDHCADLAKHFRQKHPRQSD